MDLSIVIPLYNECESLPQLFTEIDAACQSLGLKYEIIAVDDGSTDGTFEWLRRKSAEGETLTGLRLRRNCGKAAALATGFTRSKGKYIITLDGDLQDQPSEIPDFIAMLEQGADMVSGWKKKRHDPWHKTLPSKLFNAVTRIVSGLPLHDFNCGYKAYRREVVQSIDLYGEMHRYIPVIANWNGYAVEEKVVAHKPRQFGRSKYGFSRLFNGFFDLITLVFLHRYTSRPLHLFGRVGFWCILFGSGLLLYFLGLWFIQGALTVRPLLVGAIFALLFGVQVFSLGLLAEMITQRTGFRYPISAETRPGKDN